MDQLAADLNNALNDANMLTSSMSNVTMTSANSIKIRRRRKRPNPNEFIQKKNTSGSTTPENFSERFRRRSFDDQFDFLTDPEDIGPIPSKKSQSVGLVSESDSPPQNEATRRRRRIFKKPFTPTSSMIVSTDQTSMKKSTRFTNVKLIDSDQISSLNYVRRRRLKTFEINQNGAIPSSSSTLLPVTTNQTHFVGKRKRSRAIQEDFRLRNSSSHDFDVNCADESHLANLSSGSSLNLSDSDKEPYLTSNEADDEQSDWPRDETSVSKIISWWEEKSSDQESDQDEKMLTTTDGTLQKIVNGALNMMLSSSKASIQNRIKYLANREMLTGHRRHTGSKNCSTHQHSKRNVRLLKDARRSHHHSYNHKRVKNDHCPSKINEFSTPIDSMNIGHQLLEKIGWKPGDGLGLNQNGITAPIQINYRNHREGLGYENTPMETGERLENEPTNFETSQINEI